MLELHYRKFVTGKWRAYFNGLEKFYGEGNTKEEALAELYQKLQLVLAAIGKIQSGE